MLVLELGTIDFVQASPRVWPAELGLQKGPDFRWAASLGPKPEPG